MSSILETKNVAFSYENGEDVLKEVSSGIPEGKKTVILGPNGSGKSTLMLHYNGVLKPKKGSVSFRREPLRYDRKGLTSLRQNVCLMFQNPDDQIFAATVEEDVAFGPLNLGLSRDEIEMRVYEALETVDLIKYRERPTQQLSFGQRKRVALAGALAMNPEVLMMDEPTAGLDAQMVHEMMELSEELNHKGKTIVICTHDVEMAYEWADDVILMYEGGVLYNGDIDGLLEREELLHRSRLKYPTIYKLNRQMHIRTGEHELPRPQSLPECCQKFFKSENIAPGNFYIAYVDDPGFDASIIKAFKKHNMGVFGVNAKRTSRSMGLDIHHYFYAIDQGLIKASVGEDYLLLTESSVKGLVKSRIDRFMMNYCSDIQIIPPDDISRRQHV
ncbi:cobalt transport protein ATP-binding subunit [Methanocella sp. CWC-04]|uniref:ABC transporter ATP-binding protein n=1 Tax=Methanooceanicella nereidis TaxID=2052831 RepID=A0AAP2W6L3_9EURY|nr:ABC transporter ATP-binding protein [Methanocella sp. CWC-04]MCD1295407.1 cobalt transport protein ATP-binding subunit [Methanocella sp. CWC-04]